MILDLPASSSGCCNNQFLFSFLMRPQEKLESHMLLTYFYWITYLCSTELKVPKDIPLYFPKNSVEKNILKGKSEILRNTMKKDS